MDLLLYFQKQICRVQRIIFKLGGKFFCRMTCNIMGNNLGMLRNVNFEFTCLSDRLVLSQFEFLSCPNLIFKFFLLTI